VYLLVFNYTQIKMHGATIKIISYRIESKGSFIIIEDYATGFCRKQDENSRIVLGGCICNTTTVAYTATEGNTTGFILLF
jgi:predicted RNA-binding protein (virulence factor B family)